MARFSGSQAAPRRTPPASTTTASQRTVWPDAESDPGVDPVEAAMAAAASIPHLLKPAEVADLLGISERTLERWRGTGEGPRYVSLSRKTVRYDAAEVAGFIAGRIKASTAQ